jgi:hypothetical protein
MGALLVFTGFDERQNVTVDALQGNLARIESQAAKWPNGKVAKPDRLATFNEQIGRAVASADSLLAHLDDRRKTHPDQSEHIGTLIARTNSVRAQAETLREKGANLVTTPEEVVREADSLFSQTNLLKMQPPKTLYRLRLVEIGLPLVMCCISIILALRYPLTEARWREIKEALDNRHANRDLKIHAAGREELNLNHEGTKSTTDKDEE